MDTLKAILSHPFFWGFMLGFFLCVLSVIAHFKTKGELKRLKGHLSDKLEIEAEKMSEMKTKVETLKTENENLRLKVKSGAFQSEALSLERDLEIYARAEKVMVVNAPGFAPAWEKAKDIAVAEMEAEEAGKSLPKRLFKKFFAKGGTHVEGEVVESLPSESVTKSEATAKGT